MQSRFKTNRRLALAASTALLAACSGGSDAPTAPKPGGNQPVKDLRNGRVSITSQNHGFAIDPSSLPGNVEVTHINLNDGTCEGIRGDRTDEFVGGTHGRDLTPLLEKPATPWLHPCYYEHMGNEYGAKVSQTILTGAEQKNDQGVPLYSAVVQDQFKLIHYLDGKSGEELYDLKNDPEELKNLISETSHADRITQLRTAMKAELKRTEASFTDFVK